MPDLSSFQITRKWPAQQPDRIQLYSLPTPNGVKISIIEHRGSTSARDSAATDTAHDDADSGHRSCAVR